MLPFILKRLLISIPLLLGVSFLSFTLIHLAPGNYFDTLKTNPQISKETIQKYEDQYHLDEPVYIQFYYWLKNLIKLDLGYSFVKQAPVAFFLKSYVFNTLLLALASIIVTWGIAIPLGIYSALHRSRFIDKFFSFTSLIGISFPSFLLALLLIFFVAATGILPVGSMTSLQYETFPWYIKIIDILKHMIVPVVAISLLSVAHLQRIMRGNMLEELKKNYILTARAKGLPEKRVIYRHALKNAMNPLITLLGYELAALLSGAAIIEIITNWPGLGKVMLEAVLTQDLFLVMGGIVVSSVMLVVGNLLADILLAWNDPRIRLE